MLLTISVAVIAAIFLILLIFLIPVLFQIRKTARKLGRLADNASEEIPSLAKSIRTLSLEGERILRSVRRQVETVEDGITNVNEAVLRFRVFQEEVQQRVAEPILELTALLTAMTRGLDTVVRIFRR